ncbi:AFR209Wp [Eremothecium gossypii ATCC 10895]|uniref:Vacuolar-sorting protein SNF7 n=1 Tax=Eremothecium gossypii (strain ATCC 10895 / CBS 109.51 / FGSC 9923 / NRRL Y-1056) TaxID=284811 RepID=SNF7_EREGS|nr:AFR209Wp [Eremothecium gossypii ATCC 10895]Q753W3.1 RecName: Full=Vacuolar-sorting protein SNF7; AltName: Full=Vacuolar protein-sorting-associated protein 32 [Eremothecium gossypii ATCC 10895]AAS53580.1 AFR209Wp [Eremothecium gossypii ATCC 10895]AEY97893.1 FAFR209Wp [Eremothecium gossypii FDAG1]
MWSYLFGSGNAKQKKELPKKAILELREHIQLLSKKQAHLQTQMTSQEESARHFLSKGNKNMAKAALKRKKVFESQLLKIDKQVDSLEQQLYSIENANLNLETMKAMKQGASAMKHIHEGLDVERVDETMDEIREQVELGEEISEAISRPLYTGVNEIDEDELDEELDMLAQEEVARKVMEPGAAVPAAAPATKVSLPSVPSSDMPQQDRGQPVTLGMDQEEDEDERALRELQAEMGL